MMQFSVAKAQAYIANLLDIDTQSGDGAANLLNAMNLGGLRVWEARPWFGRDVDTTLSTEAPYVTGTIAVSQSGTSVTGTTTVWTTGFTGRKLTKGIGSPWYRFTRTGNTTGTIATPWAEASETVSAYSLFQDELDLPSTAETITAVEIQQPWPRMEQRTQEQMDRDYYVNQQQGIPRVWGPTETQTTGIRRIRVSPVPNAIYRIRVRYLAAWTDLVGPNDMCVLGTNRQRAWLLASTLEAQRSGDARIVTSDAEVEAAIQEAWTKEQATSPLVVRRMPVGGRGIAAPMYWTDDTTVGGL